MAVGWYGAAAPASRTTCSSARRSGSSGTSRPSPARSRATGSPSRDGSASTSRSRRRSSRSWRSSGPRSRRHAGGAPAAGAGRARDRRRVARRRDRLARSRRSRSSCSRGVTAGIVFQTPAPRHLPPAARALVVSVRRPAPLALRRLPDALPIAIIAAAHRSGDRPPGGTDAGAEPVAASSRSPSRAGATTSSPVLAGVASVALPGSSSGSGPQRGLGPQRWCAPRRRYSPQRRLSPQPRSRSGSSRPPRRRRAWSCRRAARRSRCHGAAGA